PHTSPGACCPCRKTSPRPRTPHSSKKKTASWTLPGPPLNSSVVCAPCCPGRAHSPNGSTQPAGRRNCSKCCAPPCWNRILPPRAKLLARPKDPRLEQPPAPCC